MHDTDPRIIHVQATGTAATKFTSATFRASVTANDKTGPAAKVKAKPLIEAIRKVIEEHKDSASLDLSRVKTTFCTEPYHTHGTDGRRYMAGYNAIYTITFDGKDVVEALKVHDALTDIEGVVADTPTFNLDDDKVAQQAAFEDAVAKAKEKFRCQALGVGFSAEQYEVISWTVETTRGHGKMLSFVSNEALPESTVEPGKAIQEMNVILLYAPKSKG